MQALLIAGLTVLFVSASLTWAGARSFDGHPISPIYFVLSAIAWCGVHWVPLPPPAVGLIGLAIPIAFCSAAALSIKRGSGEALRARLPASVLLAAHALTLMLAVPASLTMTGQPNQPPPLASWFGVIHFEILIFAIGSAIFLIVMMKERNEGRLLATSYTDALTGVANRRGFFLKAERVLARCRGDGAPVAVVAFDLDRFKAINDTGGHAAGDRVLQVFAEVCERLLRPGDLIGRLGGEEFAAIIPGSGIETGYAMAERIRKAVAEAVTMIEGSAVKFTVSGGVAVSATPDDIHALLRQADTGLYRAKSLGRNRIECFGTSRPIQSAANRIRIA